MFFNGRNDAIIFKEHFGPTILEARRKEIERLLTLKQMLQRLPIALAQVKASNNSEKLIKKIRQIVYLLYQ